LIFLGTFLPFVFDRDAREARFLSHIHVPNYFSSFRYPTSEMNREYLKTLITALVREAKKADTQA
jgi:hypothetical protein